MSQPRTLRPGPIADAAERLRQRSVALFDDLTGGELDTVALPAREEGGEAWTVADVFRHLAEVDRRTVLGSHLLAFLPGTSESEFEDDNDRMLERLRDVPRPQLREELITWGRRMRRIVRWTPDVVARRTVPTMFGRVSLSWFAALRVYDEWVHEDDIRRALGRDPLDPDEDTRELLAEFHLRGLPPQPLQRIDRRYGLVEVAFSDVLAQPAWRFDLDEHLYGPRVAAEPTVRIETDVPTWTRIAADRIDWRDAERRGELEVVGEDRAAAEALLDVVRIV